MATPAMDCADIGDRYFGECGESGANLDSTDGFSASLACSVASTSKGSSSFVVLGSGAARSNVVFNVRGDAPSDGLSMWFSKNTDSPGLCFLSPKAVLPGPSGAVVNNLSATLTDAFALLELENDGEDSGSGSQSDSRCTYESSEDPCSDLLAEIDALEEGKSAARRTSDPLEEPVVAPTISGCARDLSCAK